MKDIKTGEYVRFENGVISQMEEGKIIGDFLFSEVVKSSPNIIDLIEVGDVVRGKDNHLFEVYAVGSDCVYINNLEEFILIKDIKGIVTKEAFERMEYRIGE